MLLLNFIVGLIVNFIGYAPPGNINLTVVQLTVSRGIKHAMYFIISFSIVEFFFTYGIMYFADWFAGHKTFMYWLDWALIAILFAMAIVTWRAKTQEKRIDYSKGDSVKYGILLGFLNPMQVPFWMVWGTYMISHQWIIRGNGALAVMSIGASAGSFLCLYCFAKFSNYLHARFAFSINIINKSIAVTLFAIAIYMLIRALLPLLR